MRYQIITTNSTNDSRTQMESRTREMADKLFADTKATLQPGERVELHDTQKMDAKKATTFTVLNSWYVPTAAERLEERDRHLDRYIERELEYRESIVEFNAKLTKDIDNDPTYHFGWADSAFEAAARYHVALVMKQHRTLSPDVENARVSTWEEILEALERETMRMARSPGRSSSVCSNLAEQCRLSAYARAVEEITMTLRWAK